MSFSAVGDDFRLAASARPDQLNMLTRLRAPLK